MWLISFCSPSVCHQSRRSPHFRHRILIACYHPANFWPGHHRKACVTVCTCTTLPPISNHRQSIHPPALSSYLYSNVPPETYLNRLSNSESRPNSHLTHPQDSSAPLKNKYLNPLAPSWQPTTLTPPTPPYRMAEEVSAILSLSNAQRWLNSNDRCR